MKLSIEEMEQKMLEELCDVLDAPELYDDCVLAIHRTTHQVAVGSPMTFNREYTTYPLMDMFRMEEESQEYEVDPDAVQDILSQYEAQ